jgi:predicted DsbA family dithiol-disulfide isomerase
VDKNKRNTFLTIGALGLGFGTYRFAPSLIPETLTLEPMDRPHGFREYVAGETSAGSFDAFVGLDSDVDQSRIGKEEIADARVNDNICQALYPGLNLKAGQVPIASFSDYYCPYCRVQTKRLAEMVENNSNAIAVAWHELPLLGNNSNRAAKAALAAKRQGAYVSFHEALMKTPFSATPGYLSLLAKRLNIDGQLLVADMNGKSVAEELENSAALSRVFGFFGTPALVIGRTVIQGKISDKMIAKIVDLERREGWIATCGNA